MNTHGLSRISRNHHRSGIISSPVAVIIATMTLRELILPQTGWLENPARGRVRWLAAVTVLGMAAYGFSVGYWRDPWMAVFVSIKLPLLIFLTLACNGLLNGLFGILLGGGFSFRESLMALLAASALAAVILGSLAPITFLMAWNAPPPDSPDAATAHAAYMVTHTFLIGFAGITANVHLHRLLLDRSPSPIAATATLLAWLAGNGVVGAQFAWILRPFFGTPTIEVQFLRENPMHGGFHIAVWHALERITGGHPIPALIALLGLLSIPVALAIRSHHQPQPTP